MDSMMLTAEEYAPASGSSPLHLVILVHGYGADGADLISLAPMLAASLPHTHFIAPHAPFSCEMAPMGKQWFSLKDWSPISLRQGAKDAAPFLDTFVDKQRKRFGLKESAIAWLGFSQGTMMALYVALRRTEACAAIVGFSGALVNEEEIHSKPPVCLVHGDNDMVVPYPALELARTALIRHNVPTEAHTRPGMGHGIDAETVDIAVRFLKAHLI